MKKLRINTLHPGSNGNYILTGATGILGSHILYELMMEIHQNNYNGQIILLIRSKKGITPRQRFSELLKADIVPAYLSQVDIQRICRDHITLVDSDICNLAFGLSSCPGKKKYMLIHCAASVNLGSSEAAFEEIRQNNYLATLNLIRELKDDLVKVSYVSSAFSLTNKEGEIVESARTRKTEDFRNHYERFKAETEQEVIRICETFGLDWQIFRPSIICGRLVDYPYHVIPKFLVFYLFGAFFYRTKKSYGTLPVRILMDNSSGLNLIPVDYCAKAIFRALHTDIKELNIVSRKNIPNTVTIPAMMNLIGWNNYRFLEEMPADLNAVEKLYYRTVGPQLNNYLTTPGNPDATYNTDLLSKLMHDVKEPGIEEQFQQLCSYAVERQFCDLVA